MKRFQKTSFLTRIFLTLRYLLTPYQTISNYLPKEGKLLDLGCGHGMFSLSCALRNPKLTVKGFDHDKERIEIAKDSSRGLNNISFENRDLQEDLFNEEWDAISLIDLLHYFKPSEQEMILKKVTAHLNASNGTLLLREVDPSKSSRSLWNRFYEKIATQIGFTKTRSANHSYRTPSEWLTLLNSLGLSVDTVPCSSRFFSDILFVGRKLPAPPNLSP